MWIRVIKSFDLNGRKRTIGRVINVTNELGKKLIEDKTVIIYSDGFPVKKVKTDFFKTKN